MSHLEGVSELDRVPEELLFEICLALKHEAKRLQTLNTYFRDKYQKYVSHFTQGLYLNRVLDNCVTINDTTNLAILQNQIGDNRDRDNYCHYFIVNPRILEYSIDTSNAKNVILAKYFTSQDGDLQGCEVYIYKYKNCYIQCIISKKHDSHLRWINHYTLQTFPANPTVPTVNTINSIVGNLILNEYLYREIKVKRNIKRSNIYILILVVITFIIFRAISLSI